MIYVCVCVRVYRELDSRRALGSSRRWRRGGSGGLDSRRASGSPGGCGEGVLGDSTCPGESRRLRSRLVRDSTFPGESRRLRSLVCVRVYGDSTCPGEPRRFTVSGDSTCLGESRRLRSRERVRDCTLSAPRGSPRRFWEEGRSLVCTLARSHAGLVYSHRAPGRPGGCGGRRAGRSFFALARTLARYLLTQERARYGIGEGLKGEAHAREVHGRFAGLKGQRAAHVVFLEVFRVFVFID
jgi:hypothetical protein